MIFSMVNERGTAWSEANIRARVAKEVQRTGITISKLPPSFAENKKWGANGPTLRVLTAAADALGWSLGQLLGIEPTDTNGERIPPPIDDRIIRQAVRLALEATPNQAGLPTRERYDIVAEVVLEACKSIATIAQESPELAFSDGALKVISVQLRDLFARSVSG